MEDEKILNEEQTGYTGETGEAGEFADASAEAVQEAVQDVPAEEMKAAEAAEDAPSQEQNAAEAAEDPEAAETAPGESQEMEQETAEPSGNLDAAKAEDGTQEAGEELPGRMAAFRENLRNTATGLRDRLDDAGARLRARNAGEHVASEHISGEDGVGVVRIADEVVAMIASYAAREIDGVTDMAGTATVEWLGKVGYKNPMRGVRVEVAEGRVRASLSIVMAYGYNIPATSSRVQARVKQAIENMTGLEVTDVDVRIAGITLPDGTQTPEKKSAKD